MLATKRLLSFHSLGRNGETPRLWLENHRLSSLGFNPGQAFNITFRAGNVMVIERAAIGTNRISARRDTPILDICSASKLAGLAAFDQVRISGTIGKLMVSPTIQAFHIARGLKPVSTFKVLELFAGGGTFSTSIRKNPRFEIAAALEFDDRFANEWGRHDENALLMIGDIRKFTAADFPAFDVLVAGIPCVDFSNLGRAKKHLAGNPEAGKQADLFIPVLSLIANRMPRAVVLENVPSFMASSTGTIVRNFLGNLGYHVSEQVLDAHRDFGDLQDRKRWCLVATLEPGFQIVPPGTPCTRTAAECLDAADPERDRADAERIAGTVACLDRRIVAHREKGNGFGYSVIDSNSTKIATLTKSMHKINQGPFVATPYGLRMPRKSELEAISGHKVMSDSFATACQIIGQGTSVITFTEVFRQLSGFLADPAARAVVSMPAPIPTVGQLDLAM